MFKTKKTKKTKKKNKNKFLRGFRQKQRGFTLIESLVAITILVSAVAGPLTIASKGLIDANITKEQFTAFYLAQEAVEILRNKRDENAINDIDWLSGLSLCTNPTGCYIDATSYSVGNCNMNGCINLRREENTGLYGYNSDWTETKLNRYLKIDPVNDHEILLTVKVSWEGRYGYREIVVKEFLFDWQSKN